MRSSNRTKLIGPLLIGVRGMNRLVTGCASQLAGVAAASIRKASRAGSTPACNCASTRWTSGATSPWGTSRA